MTYPDTYNGLHGHLHQQVRASARAIVPILMEMLQPRSVVDVGCGTGIWLAAFAECRITDTLGLDGDYIDPAGLHIPREFFRPTDLSQPFTVDRDYDLAICLEVAEHIPESQADALIDSLAVAAPAIFFSAAIPGQGGMGHVNEQWPSYWQERFRQRGYVAFDSVRRRVWNDSTVLYWYAQNSLLFVRESALARFPALAAEPRQFVADVVHPRRYLTLDRTARAGEAPSLGFLAKSVPGAAARFVKARLGMPLNLREPSHE